MADPRQTQQPDPYPAMPPLIRKSMESGLITLAAVNENRRPLTSVSESVNFDFDTIGSAKLRPGITQLGNTLASSDIMGLYYFVDSVNATPKTQLIVVNAGTAYYLSGGSYTQIRAGLTQTSKARFSTFLNFAFMVNGTESTAIWDGNTAGSFVTTGNALNAPTGKFIENYRSRMWIAGNTTYPDRLYYSSVPSAVGTPIITWNTDPTTGLWIDISPSDGENITGLMRSRNALLVFKPNHLYRVYSIGQTDPDPYFAVGTSSQESIVETKSGVYFHHSTGFYQYNTYGVIQEISRPIIDLVRAIPASSWPKVTAVLDPYGDRISWAVGDVTVKGITYKNLVLRYTISTQVWTMRSYPSQFVMGTRRYPLYTDGTNNFVLVGDTGGKVYQYDLGKDDAGVPIAYSLIHSWDIIDGTLSTRNTIMTGLFTHTGGTGTKVQYQIEDVTEGVDPENDWTKEAGQLKNQDTGFNTMNIKARKVRFRISGVSSGEPFEYKGYELIGVTEEFIQFSN